LEAIMLSILISILVMGLIFGLIPYAGLGHPLVR